MPNTNRKGAKARYRIVENVTYQLRDKEGRVKPIFVPNAVVRFLVRKGLLSPLHPQNFLFGRFRTSLTISNLVTDAGKAGVASRINGSGGEAAFTYIAIGTGTTAAAAGDTALQTEITTGGGARAAATASRVTTDVTNDTARLVLTFNFTASFAVTESGALNASSGGVLLARQVFSAINVVSGDSLQVTWNFDVD